MSAGGDPLAPADLKEPVPSLPAGEEADLSVSLTAPNATGRHVAYFKLQTPEGAYFGQRLWADVRIAEDENANSWHVISSSNAAAAAAGSGSGARAGSETDNIPSSPPAPPASAAPAAAPAAVIVQADDAALPGEQASDAVAEAHAEWAVVWEKELGMLRDMGFTDASVLLPLLQEHCVQPVSLMPELNGIPPAAGMQDVLAVLLSRSGRQF